MEKDPREGDRRRKMTEDRLRKDWIELTRRVAERKSRGKDEVGSEIQWMGSGKS